MAGLDIGSILNLVSGDGIAALGKASGVDEKDVTSVVSAAVPVLPNVRPRSSSNVFRMMEGC